MRNILTNVVQKSMNALGYQIRRLHTPDPVIDQDETFGRVFEKCRHYTMTSRERMYALFKAVAYIVEANVDGALVECGVWRGGSSMLMALALLEFGINERKLYLYDTYAGMSKPTDEDYPLSDPSEKATATWNATQKQDHNEWCFVPLEEVEHNMLATGYPKNNIVLVKGRVEETIPRSCPTAISLLRLDTDWYESTKHELCHLYPIVKRKGVVIIDDYGCLGGAKKAVDEYFAKRPILLNRIDDTGRIGVKTDD